MTHDSDQKKKKKGEQGKYAEKKVKEFLDKWSNRKDHDYCRLPDARSCMGRIPKQVGDFLFFGGSNLNTFPYDFHGVIEVKETKHKSRITKAAIDQIPKLRLRLWAGGKIVILIYHSGLKLWRCPPFQLFLNDLNAPSWDLSELPTFKSVEEALTHKSLGIWSLK